MSCRQYTPLTKVVVLEAVGKPPPVNGTVKIHIKQMLTDGTLLSDSIQNHPRGHDIDLTNTHVLSSLIDELLVMVPGEIAQFHCEQEEMDKGLFSVRLPPGENLVLEVEMLDWSGQDISPDQNGSIRKSIIEEGSSRGQPCWTGKCCVSIEPEGDSAKETLFRLGDGDTYGVDHCIELCVLTMIRNEICFLETPDQNYTLKLISFEKERALYKMSKEEVLDCGDELKLRGNNAYKSGKLRLARLYYERCLKYVEGVVKSEQDDRSTALTKACYLNLAQVCLKGDDIARAASYCTSVLWTDSGCVKALYRRASAYDLLEMHDEAITDLDKLLKLEAENKEAQQLLHTVRIHKQQKSQREKSSMRIVFQKIEEEHEKTGANGPPPKSVWEEAEETCPPELATEEAYAVYKGALDEEEKTRKAEEAARLAEYQAANPPKKKKKKKKKKKAAISEVAIAETEEIPVDKPPVEQPVPEPDAGMTYQVTAEKTFINQIEDLTLANIVTPDKPSPQPEEIAKPNPEPEVLKPNPEPEVVKPNLEPGEVVNSNSEPGEVNETVNVSDIAVAVKTDVELKAESNYKPCAGAAAIDDVLKSDGNADVFVVNGV